MAMVRGVLSALLVVSGLALPAAASPRATIDAMRGQPATQWQGIVVDLNLVGAYYGDPANSMIWVRDGRPTQAANDLFEAIKLAREDGLNEDDYATTALTLPELFESDKDIAGFELVMSSGISRLRTRFAQRSDNPRRHGGGYCGVAQAD